MPKKPNGAGGMQEYIPAGNGDASGEYGNSKGENKHFSSFKKGSSAKSETKGGSTSKAKSNKKYTKGTIANYKGYGIDYDIYGNGEFSVQYGGDDILFDSEEEARTFIDSKEDEWTAEDEYDDIERQLVDAEDEDEMRRIIEDAPISWTEKEEIAEKYNVKINNPNKKQENNNDIFSSIDDFAKDDQLKKGITSQQAYDEMLKGKDIWEVLSVDGSLDTALREKIVDKMTKDLNLSKEDWAKVGVTIYDNDNKTRNTNSKPKPVKQTPKAQKEKTGLKAFDENDRWDDNDYKEINDYLNNNPDIKKEVEKRLRDEHKIARNYYPNDEKFNAMVDEDLEGQLASLNDMSSMRYLETLPRDRLVTAIEESIREKNKSQNPTKNKQYENLDDTTILENARNNRINPESNKLAKGDSVKYAMSDPWGKEWVENSKILVDDPNNNAFVLLENGKRMPKVLLYKTQDTSKEERKQASKLFNVDL